MMNSHLTRTSGIIAVGIALSLCRVAAQQEPVSANTQAVQELPELTLASHFVGVPYNKTGVSVSIINPAALQQEGIETFTGALSQTPGVFTLDGGGTWQRGSISNTMIRGMYKESYSLTMIDGMRISDVNMGGGKVLGITNLFTVGNAEVVKGAQGAVFGSGAIGGVITLDTPLGEGVPQFKLFAETGSFGTANTHATWQGKVKKLSYFIGVGFETTENDPGIYPAGFSNRAIEVNDFRQWQEAMRLCYEPNDKVKLNVTYRRLDSRFEYPAVAYDPATWASMDRLYTTIDKNRSNLMTARIDAELTEKWSTSFMAGYYTMNYSIHNPEYDFQPNININRRLQTEWRNAVQWHKRWQSVAGMAWERSEYMVANNYDHHEEWENKLALFAEQMWSPTDSLNTSLALRLEHNSVWGNHFTWRYANSWQLPGTDSKTRLFGSVGSGYRAPTYYERYANANGYVGNPDLSISKSLGGDLGVEQQLAPHHHATFNVFWIRINDEIGADYASYPTTWLNYSHMTSYGAELALKGDFQDAWRSGYRLSYTYTMPKMNDKGSSASVQAAQTAKNVIAAELHTSPFQGLTVGVGVTGVTGRTDWKRSRLDNFYTMRIFARYQVTDQLTLHCRVENLTDQNYIINTDYDLGEQQARGLGIFGGITLEF